MQRPLTASIFGILHIVFGSVVFLLNCCNTVVLPIAPLIDDPQIRRDLNERPEFVLMQEEPVFFGFLLGSTIGGTIVGAVLLASGIGLWKGWPWARFASNVVACVGILLAALQIIGTAIFMPPPEATGAAAVPIFFCGFLLLSLYPILMLIFLNRRPVKDWLDPARPRYAEAPVGPVIEPWDR